MFGEDGVLVMNSKINNNMNKQPVNNQSKNNNTQNTSGFTEDWISVKSISNGMIILPHNEKVTGVKIYPKNIFILDPIQQEGILNAMKNFYNMLNFEFWMIAADRPVDISVYQSQLQIMLQNAQNPAQIKIIAQDIDKANMFINNQVVDTEYYVLFKEKNMDLLQQKLRDVINGFASCSLSASPTSDDEMRLILDNFLNGGVRTDFGTVVVR